MNKYKSPTSIKELDIVLDGGLPIGRLIHIYGAPGMGKSTLVYKILANCREYSCLIDTEGSFSPTYAYSLGVELQNLFIAEIRKSADIFSFLKKVISDDIFRYIIIDSIAGLPIIEIYSYIAKKLPNIIKELEKHNTILIFTNQIRAKGKKTKAAHGAIINASSSVVLEITNKYKTKEGYESTINVIKNKFGIPGGEIKLHLGGETHV